MLVDDVMTSQVVSLREDQTVSEAVQRLAENGISGAPVLSAEGRLVGIITERDILNTIKSKSSTLEMVYPSLSMVSVSFIEKLDQKETMEAFREIAETKVSEIMTRNVSTVQSGSSLGLVVNLILLKGVNRIPVMEGGKLVGIVSRADIMKGLARSNVLK